MRLNAVIALAVLLSVLGTAFLVIAAVAGRTGSRATGGNQPGPASD